MIKFFKNTKNQLRCYGNHHSCYGLRRIFELVTTKIYDSFLSKNVYKTEIDKVEPKLWRFTFGTLILGHPVCPDRTAEERAVIRIERDKKKEVKEVKAPHQYSSDN